MTSYIDKFRLDNKVAYVVGGLGLIGAEVTRALASVGAKVVVMDLKDKSEKSLESDLNREGYDVVFNHFDCSDLTHIDENFNAIFDEIEKMDIFVNCSYPRTEDWGQSSFKDITVKSYRENVDIHMNSYAWLAKRAADVMINNANGGSIIQFGSTYGVVGQDLTVYEGTEMGESMTYSAIKGGITNLTRTMASYYGKYNIRVNTLCPGGLVGHVAGKSDEQDPVFVKNYSKKTPLKRMGNPEEISTVAIFLASDAASYITGATIMVDGGWTAV
jgi:NAD(P)-dependent dehydrogenase (short-subunit alcohol dehydrogenase family)|tara:strand:- start:1478 stop:2296 length:819 start_codon:yes stop_codon:yes gene_type:complete